ncbi:glycosyltransferase family 2 protein, partial [Campylobacter coli]|nr:glycosyltransferase family 2 protein [Campylobacter coli]
MGRCIKIFINFLNFDKILFIILTKFRKNMPQLSIIIPLFNSCDFILRALQSCINQTLKDIEI